MSKIDGLTLKEYLRARELVAGAMNQTMYPSSGDLQYAESLLNEGYIDVEALHLDRL